MLDAKHPTVAAMLRQKGYATGAFVGAFPLDSRFGLNNGFETYDDDYGKGVATTDFSLQERPATAVLEAATKWWHSAEGRKRFLWVHLYDPHAPYRPPEPFASQYRSDEYLGEIAAVDDALARALGPILAASPKALVVVTGDHGEARGDHGELTHGLFAYESTLHVPLLVAGAGLGHRIENGYVRHIDIVPTLLECAGLPKPAPLLGASLLAATAGRDTYFEALSASLNRGWAPLTGVIHDGAKYIDLPLAELYHLPRDPGELRNVRDEERREVEQARQLLAPAHAAGTAPRQSVSAEEIARLRSLGYVSGSAQSKSEYTAADDPKTMLPVDNALHQVVDAFERHDVARSLRIARGIVAQRPQMNAGRELLAFVLQQTDQTGEAIEQLKAIVAGGTSTDDNKVQLALLLTETGKGAEAVALLQPLSTSRNPDVLNALGVSLADQGKEDEALRTFERALALDPSSAPALQNIGIVALKRDDAATARSYLTRALALNPKLPLALNTMGVLHARDNDFPTAVDYWSRAVEADPRQYDALFNIGLVEGRSGHREAARRALTRFVETAPPARYAADIAAARKALQ
ncbi:MAG: hypothetical protein JWN02_984 [Acidobacteria bacterium]|nr:hypothetical protein [Acidobacteriota bacterium]